MAQVVEPSLGQTRVLEEPMELVPGSFINIPAHQRHRVDWTDPKNNVDMRNRNVTSLS